ncbi:transcriptional regulator [Cohnella xylanilytica]|uniref:helix-turn-helix domain-containing protein n=1 Tax=Cohnella xylanilytica TaxID=557555 RepID=UPI001B1BAA94|nr:helix-turn-helix transcriptional regulator [Cohnella xylanilytica]GIO15777.1 transcriptional regulator [Cohnella xylanilytica]
MTIDEILKAIRKELNVSQEQLARDLNVSFTTLNRWENNRSKPSRLASNQIKDYCIQKGISKNIIAELDHS